MQMAPTSSPAGQARQPALLLFFRAVIQHVVRAHAVYALPERADAAPGQLGVHHCLVAEVAASAAVFGRHIQQQQAGVACLARGFAIHVMLLAPAGIVRNHLGFNEAYDGVAEDLEVVVHPGNDIGIHGDKVSARNRDPPTDCRNYRAGREARAPATSSTRPARAANSMEPYVASRAKRHSRTALSMHATELRDLPRDRRVPRHQRNADQQRSVPIVFRPSWQSGPCALEVHAWTT